MNVLIVEDEAPIAKIIRDALTSEGHSVTWCGSVDEVVSGKHALYHDVIVLDLMLDGESGGEELIRHLRTQNDIIPILVVSAVSSTQTKVDLINLGADDYLSKPFDPNELVARVNALYRRSMVLNLGEKVDLGEQVFHPKRALLVEKNGGEIDLSPRECQIFELLVKHEGRVVPNEVILQQVWGISTENHSNLIKSTIRRLRKKVDADRPETITTIHGEGYRFMRRIKTHEILTG